MRMHNPSHPGEILKEDIEARGYTTTAFAEHIGVSRVALSRVLNCKAGVTPEMSIRLSQALATSPDLWFRVQNQYDFWRAEQAMKRKKIKPVVKVRGMAKAA